MLAGERLQGGQGIGQRRDRRTGQLPQEIGDPGEKFGGVHRLSALPCQPAGAVTHTEGVEQGVATTLGDADVNSSSASHGCARSWSVSSASPVYAIAVITIAFPLPAEHLRRCGIFIVA